MSSIVCPVIHAGIFPQHNPQIVYYADQAFMLSENSAIWYLVVGECCSLPVQMKARHRVEVAFHIHLLIDPFFLSSSVHRLKAFGRTSKWRTTTAELSVLPPSFPLFQFLLFLFFSRSPFHWEQTMSSEEKSSTMSQKISSPSHSNSSSSSKHDSRQVSLCMIWQLMSYIYGSITLVCAM